MPYLDALQRIANQNGVGGDVRTFLLLYSLCFARMAGVIAQAPFFGGQSAPGRVKIGLAAILAAILYPSITPAGGLTHPLSPLLFAALLIKETLIGIVIGMLSQLVFYSIQMAGTLIDSQRGANQMNFLAPQLAGPTSVLGQLQFQTALVLFLTTDGHLLFLRGLHQSFSYLPVLEIPKLQAGLLPVIEQMIRLSADTLSVALRLSAPVLLALFLVDMSFGMLGRVAGQMNIHGESQPVKAWVGLGVFFLAAGLMMDNLLLFFASAHASILEMVHALR